MFKKYELTYLISPETKEGELNAFCEKISGFILQEQGIIDHQFNPVLKKLAYPIKKKTEAFLATINFQIEPQKIEEVEKKLKTENQILRHIIIIKIPVKKIKERARQKPKETETPSFKKEEGHFPKKREATKAELKEIDKKIEEILNQ